MPGIGVVFIQRYNLDAARCLYVGEGGADAAFARRMGFRHEEAEEFFDPDRRPTDFFSQDAGWPQRSVR